MAYKYLIFLLINVFILRMGKDKDVFHKEVFSQSDSTLIFKKLNLKKNRYIICEIGNPKNINAKLQAMGFNLKLSSYFIIDDPTAINKLRNELKGKKYEIESTGNILFSVYQGNEEFFSGDIILVNKNSWIIQSGRSGDYVVHPNLLVSILQNNRSISLEEYVRLKR